MLKATIKLLPLALVLLAVSAARADEPPPPLVVHAQTDITAALLCYSQGFRYMLRLGPADVLCLHTTVAAKRAVDIEKAYPGLRRPQAPGQ